MLVQVKMQTNREAKWIQSQRKAAWTNTREAESEITIKIERHDSSFSYIPPRRPPLLLMHSDRPRCFPLYSIMSHFPGLSCHFRFPSEPLKSHFNPQTVLNMTTCHSRCHRAACFERGAEGKYICTTVNSVHNNSFDAFPLCAKCKQKLSSKTLQYCNKLLPGTWNNSLFGQCLSLWKHCRPVFKWARERMRHFHSFYDFFIWVNKP